MFVAETVLRRSEQIDGNQCRLGFLTAETPRKIEEKQNLGPRATQAYTTAEIRA